MSCLADAREMGQPSGLPLGSLVAQTRFALQPLSASSQVMPSIEHVSPSVSVVQSARLGSSEGPPQAGSPQVEYHLRAAPPPPPAPPSLPPLPPPLLLSHPASVARSPSARTVER